MTSSPHGFYELGYICATKNITKLNYLSIEKIKNILNMDCKLKLIYMKQESPVIVFKYGTMNWYFVCVQTARHMPKSCGRGILFCLVILIKLLF